MTQPAVPEPSEPARPVRASDAERERIAEMVRRAVGDGRLTLSEGDERLAEVYATVHRGELSAHIADLGDDDPFAVSPPEPARSPARSPSRSPAPVGARPSVTTAVALMSGSTRTGDWTPGRTQTAVALMGGVELTFTDARLGDEGLSIVAVAVMGGVEIDLRGADIGPDGVTVQALAIMGGVDVLVDERTRVVESGFAIMGGFDDSSGAPSAPGGPEVRVRGFALMGGVEVTRRPLGIDEDGQPELPAGRDDDA